MNREIKFRAWFVESQVMYSWEDLINNIGISSTTFVETEAWKPMQYTGRKDKNSKEIYDGHIVKLCYGIPRTYDTFVIEYADDESVADISVSGWWMRNIRPNGVSGSLCKTYENDLEIIGDRHTTPQLLEDKQ